MTPEYSVLHVYAGSYLQVTSRLIPILNVAPDVQTQHGRDLHVQWACLVGYWFFALAKINMHPHENHHVGAFTPSPRDTDCSNHTQPFR